MNTFLAKFKTIDKEYFLVKDLNLNLIDYQSNAEVRDFVNLIFQHRLVPVAIKPTRFTEKLQRSSIASSLSFLLTKKS